MKAHLSDEVIAEARDDEIVWVDGIPYFPPGIVTDGSLERVRAGIVTPLEGPGAPPRRLGRRHPSRRWSLELFASPASAVSVAGADFSGYVAYALTEIDVRSGPDGDMGRDRDGDWETESGMALPFSGQPTSQTIASQTDRQPPFPTRRHELLRSPARHSSRRRGDRRPPPSTAVRAARSDPSQERPR